LRHAVADAPATLLALRPPAAGKVARPIRSRPTRDALQPMTSRGASRDQTTWQR
jgi:hypothetical protein